MGRQIPLPVETPRTVMTVQQTPSAIPDVQNSADSRQLAINKVGIKSIRHPIKVLDKNGGVQHTIAVFNMYVGLPHNFKGTHMSRFVEILNSHEREISVESFEPMLREMVKKLEAETGHVEMTFPYFINKAAPVSGVQSLMDYEITFIGEIRAGGLYEFTMKVVVPVTSLCPCSKKISAYGAHNQRSHVTVTATTNDHLWIEELVQLVEGQASCELYGLLKRPDEKAVTERALRYCDLAVAQGYFERVRAEVDTGTRAVAESAALQRALDGGRVQEERCAGWTRVRSPSVNLFRWMRQTVRRCFDRAE